ncbi:hypothetical protein PsYK624_109520 [Phanerochaete sordida]|uniref:Uncharacterized protein n=1 Tax=Phanerochaete sordida TaxID=48140 RepID=A0A9P3LHL3_9APHY|nr:hypothetical protein PsYK624_109520 [Phanerochaete sordida]
MQHRTTGAIPLYDLKARFAAALVGLRPLLTKPLLTPLFVLESRAGDDPGDDPSILLVVPYALRHFNSALWQVQGDNTQSSDGETTLVAESPEDASCGAGADYEPVAEERKVSPSSTEENALVAVLVPGPSSKPVGSHVDQSAALGPEITTQEPFQFDSAEGSKCEIVFPTNDYREPEATLSWHHSGMYLTRQRPETKACHIIVCTLAPDTTAVRLPGMRRGLLVKDGSVLDEVPGSAEEAVPLSSSPTVNPPGLNQATMNAQHAGTTFGAVWAGGSHSRPQTFLAYSHDTPIAPSPRQAAPRRELNPRAQEFFMSSPGIASYTSPKLAVQTTIAPQPTQPLHLPIPDPLSEPPLLPSFTPSPEAPAYTLPDPFTHAYDAPASQVHTGSSSLLAILNGAPAYDLSPTPLLPALSLSPKSPGGSPHAAAYTLRNGYHDLSPSPDGSPSLFPLFHSPLTGSLNNGYYTNGIHTDTFADGPIIPSGPVDRISSPDDPPLVRRTPVGTRTPPRGRPWYARPQSAEPAPAWPPILPGRSLSFSPSP